MLILYGLKNCDTCKKALKALEAQGKLVTFVDIRADTDLTAKLPEWLKVLSRADLVNKRSTTWRGMSDAEQAAALVGPEAGSEDSLIATPTLIKRPVIEASDQVTCGWTKTQQTVWL